MLTKELSKLDTSKRLYIPSQALGTIKSPMQNSRTRISNAYTQRVEILRRIGSDDPGTQGLRDSSKGRSQPLYSAISLSS